MTQPLPRAGCCQQRRDLWLHLFLYGLCIYSPWCVKLQHPDSSAGVELQDPPSREGSGLHQVSSNPTQTICDLQLDPCSSVFPKSPGFMASCTRCVQGAGLFVVQVCAGFFIVQVCAQVCAGILPRCVLQHQLTDSHLYKKYIIFPVSSFFQAKMTRMWSSAYLSVC